MIDKFVDAHLREIRVEPFDQQPLREQLSPNVYVGRGASYAEASQRAVEAFLDAYPELEADVEPDVRAAWLEKARNKYGHRAAVWERDPTTVKAEVVLSYDGEPRVYAEFEFVLIVDEQRASRWLSERLQDYEGYVGFRAGDEDEFVAVADWNSVPPILSDLAESLDFNVEWCDEVATCTGCGGIVRTQPDSYSWTPRYKDYPDGTYCEECVVSDLDEYEEYLVNEPRVDTLDVDWEARGWQKLDYEADSGLYRSNRCNRPQEIVERLRENFDVDVLFGDLRSGQFEVEWSVYVRHPERPSFHEDELEPGGLDFSEEDLAKMVDVLRGTERVGHQAKMTEAALKMAPMPANGGQNIVYSKVDVESGKVETRLVSPEEFVEGIKGGTD